MKFKAKPVVIEAWSTECDEQMPQILIDVLNAGYLDLPHISSGKVFNKIHNSWIEFNDGDWLIYSNGPDDIYPCTDAQFQKKYERV